jgi:hypothetical protein
MSRPEYFRAVPAGASFICILMRARRWLRIAAQDLTRRSEFGAGRISGVRFEGNFVSIIEIFQSFAAARAACGRGYDDGDLAEVIAYKTSLAFDSRQVAPEQALNSIIALGIRAAKITDRPLRVLDFGGGCGFHYFRASDALRIPLE